MAIAEGKYEGLDQDKNFAMTPAGRIIRDAQVFEIIPESETCTGWPFSRIQELMHKVNDQWDKYSCMVSKLPPELMERHQKIHGAALKRAKDAGWSADIETDGEA